MPETPRPNIFRELVALHNATPGGRRLIGYCGLFGCIVCLIGFFVAYQKGAGFIVFLALTFFLLSLWKSLQIRVHRKSVAKKSAKNGLLVS